MSLASRMSRTKRFASDTNGNVATLSAFALTGVAVAAGVAIDLAQADRIQSKLQTALDAAVLAAAPSAATQRNTIALATLNASLGAGLLLQSSPVWTSNPDGSFSGAATAVVPHSMLAVMGSTSSTVSARSTAAAVATPGTSSASANACITVLDPKATQALLVNSPVSINAPSCRIDVHSTGNPAAIFNSGFTQNLKGICVKGANVIRNGGAVAGLQTGCTPPADPYASAMPAVTVGACTVQNQNYAGANTLSPSVYCGNFNFNGAGSLNLQPGLYVLKGTRWNLNSGWSVKGDGVTFYFADQNSYIQINSGVKIEVTAPLAGTFKDLLFFEAPKLPKSSFTINGSAGHKFQGLFYLPSRNVTFNSVSSVQSEQIGLVFNTLILDHIDWNFQGSGFGASSGGGSSTSGVSVRLIR